MMLRSPRSGTAWISGTVQRYHRGPKRRRQVSQAGIDRHHRSGIAQPRSGLTEIQRRQDASPGCPRAQTFRTLPLELAAPGQYNLAAGGVYQPGERLPVLFRPQFAFPAGPVDEGHIGGIGDGAPRRQA